MIRINRQIIGITIDKARNSPRKRMNYNFHEDESAIVQRMLNVIEPCTYIRPHKHENPDKNEVFLLLSGKALVLEFSDEGIITEKYILDPTTEDFGAEIGPGVFHTIIALAQDTVAFEVKEGPYLPATVKQFATWAPEEGSEGVEDYLNKLIELSSQG
jgi:cupin fold WbuC family metalloprotein